MSRPGAITTPLVECAETLEDRLRVIVRDGVVDLGEQQELQRRVRALGFEVQRVHRSIRFASLALVGEGIDGAWFGRMASETASDQRRIVRPRFDPDPSGPACAGRKDAA